MKLQSYKPIWLSRSIEAFVAVALLATCMVVFSNDSTQQGITKEQIEKDLILDVRLKSAQRIKSTDAVTLDILLVNRSKATVHRVVKPGDGSEGGWREPYIFFTATVNRGDDQWQNVPKQRYGRCGLYDANWQKDVVELKPGEKLQLKNWIPSPKVLLNLPHAGRVRLYVHYAYGAGEFAKGQKPVVPVDLGPMKDIPAFELVSEPVEFEIVN